MAPLSRRVTMTVALLGIVLLHVKISTFMIIFMVNVINKKSKNKMLIVCRS